MRRVLSTVVLLTALSGIAACSSDNDGTPPTSGSGNTGGDSTGASGGGGTGTAGSDTGGTGTAPTGDTNGAAGPDGTGTGDPSGTFLGGAIGGATTGGGAGNTDGSAGSGGDTGGGGAGTGVPPQNISNAPASNAEIATDAAGNAIAVWQQHDGTRNNIYYSRFSGGAWSAPALLESLDPDATQPDVAMNSAGDALAVWTQPNPAHSNPYGNFTWARMFSPRTGWGEPVAVSNATYNYNDGPFSDNALAAIDDSGIAIALWESESIAAMGRGLAANIHRPGSGWSTEAFVHRGAWNDQANIAMDGHGNAVVGYMHDGGGGYGADPYVRYFSAANGWGTPHQFSAPGAGPDTPVAVGIDPTGVATAVWGHSEDGAYTADGLTHHRVYVSRRPQAGDWTAAVAIASATTSIFHDFDLAVAANGNAVASWRERSADSSSVWAARFENETWQTPVSIGAGEGAQVAMAGDGPFMTFLQNSRAMYTRYVGPGWSTPTALDNGGEIASEPRIAGSDYAQPFFAWLQPSGVWARRLP